VSNDDVDVRMADGRLFHARGPATANARSPMVERRVEGTTRSADDTERWRRRTVLATGTASSVKYRGAALVRQRSQVGNRRANEQTDRRTDEGTGREHYASSQSRLTYR